MDQISIDQANDMAYIRLSDNKSVKSIETDDGFIIFEFDESDELVGIELVSLSRTMEKYRRKSEEKLNPENIPLYLLPAIYHYAHQRTN